MKRVFVVLGLALRLALCLAAPDTAAGGSDQPYRVAQAMVPPTGMTDSKKQMALEQRYRQRFPQPARVGDLIGLPVLDLHASTIGYVRHIVRTPQSRIALIVSYSRLWGWFGRPVAVPLEAVGIEGRLLVSLDMPPAEYAAAATWQSKDDAILGDDTAIRIALARN
jgi:hypothetical protein